MKKFSHSALVKKARSVLLYQFNCPIACMELVTASYETPDAIGFKNSGMTSYLIECKTSRSDFHKDKNKNFRANPERGMGNYRYYLAPAGMLVVADLPVRWGLIEVPESGKPVIVHGKMPFSDWHGRTEFWQEAYRTNEIALIHSFTRRLLAGNADKYK